MPTTPQQPQMGLTFEDVWAALMETREHINKLTEEVDRVTKNVGGLNRSMGELIETLIAARLWEKFDDYFKVDKVRINRSQLQAVTSIPGDGPQCSSGVTAARGGVSPRYGKLFSYCFAPPRRKLGHNFGVNFIQLVT
ncbi:hypothetical protein FACS189483_09540 [Spirochaetia bacterium]|nr:hypothetical protein FACS189483_09540 [Spirochaetia bacterium]